MHFKPAFKMPYCTSCGSYFDGRGTYCALHNPYLFTKPQGDRFKPDQHFPDIKYRTGHNHKPHKHTNYDTYGNPNKYDRTNDNSLTLFPGPQTSSTALHQAATHFRNLADNHAINNMTFSVTSNGTKSVSVSANKDREQCAVCKKWFPDRRRLELHQWEFQSGCEVHEICFAQEEGYYHGVSYRHDRCFVRGCGSVYRREGGWKASVVEAHVREWHQ